MNTRCSWGSLFKKIASYVEENSIIIDAVVPILRGGMIPALYLGHKGKKIQLKKLFDFPILAFPLPKKPTFLLVEGNHCFGLTAKTAANDLRKRFPNCTIIYVANLMDYSYQHVVPADKVFYGKLTNETRALSKEAAGKLGLNNDLSLFPWEDLEEEWITVQGKQFQYQDL